MSNKTNRAIRWIAISPVESVNHLSNNSDQAPVVLRLDGAIWINHYGG